MIGILTPHEMRDVVAFLASLKDETGEVKTMATAAALEDAEVSSDSSANAETEESPPKNNEKIKKVSNAPANSSTTSLPDGKTAYVTCSACHGVDGEPLEAMKTLFPPLKGSEWMNSDPKVLIEMQLRGLKGPLEVKGVKYTNPGSIMPPNGQAMDDGTVAAAINYARSRWTEDWALEEYPAVTTDLVAQIRKDSVGKPMLEATELQKPRTGPPTPVEIMTADATPSWVFAFCIIWIGICLLPVLFKSRE